jgi:hypothetical protein
MRNFLSSVPTEYSRDKISECKETPWVGFHWAQIQWEKQIISRKQRCVLGLVPGTQGRDSLSIGVGQCQALTHKDDSW